MKSSCLKWPYGLYGNDNKVTTLSELYITVKDHAKFEIERTILTCLNYGRVVLQGLTPNEKKDLHLSAQKNEDLFRDLAGDTKTHTCTYIHTSTYFGLIHP